MCLVQLILANAKESAVSDKPIVQTSPLACYFSHEQQQDGDLLTPVSAPPGSVDDEVASNSSYPTFLADESSPSSSFSSPSMIVVT